MLIDSNLFPKVPINLDDVTRAKLKENSSLRCLYEARRPLDLSRRSKDVIPFAEAKARAATDALLEELGINSHDANTQLRIVQLPEVENIAFILFDIFVNGIDEEKRARIEKSLDEPIHRITWKKERYIIRRSRHLDGFVAMQLKSRTRLDKGPQPYFVDDLYPPVYVDGYRDEDLSYTMRHSRQINVHKDKDQDEDFSVKDSSDSPEGASSVTNATFEIEHQKHCTPSGQPPFPSRSLVGDAAEHSPKQDVNTEQTVIKDADCGNSPGPPKLVEDTFQQHGQTKLESKWGLFNFLGSFWQSS